jgi:hypothetical protein
MEQRSGITVSMIILAMLLVTSCRGGGPLSEPTSTPIPTVIEPGLAYGIPCKPPCWRGLIPGQSTRQEAAQVIEQLQTEGWTDHIVDGSSVFGGYSISPSPFISHGTIHVTIEDDIVTKIRSTTLLFYYPVGSIVEQFGAPEGLYPLDKGSTICSSCEEWEPPEPPDAPVESSPVHLLYPNQGLWFLALVPVSGLGCICPEMPVATFCYYSPRSMREALSDEYLTTLFVALEGATEEDLVEWHGFGGGY